MSERGLLIVGASTRAAAMSARRAGFCPWCVDLFGDRDLRAIADVRICPPQAYPGRMVELAREFPPGPWMYTGGLENHPDVVEAISTQRPLIGNGPTVLNAIRDPCRLEAELRIAGFPTLRHGSATRTPKSGRWLLKPRRGTGGIGIRCWDGVTPLEEHTYLQQYQAGRPISVVAFADDARVRLLGATHQLIGDRLVHAKPFRYCGSITAPGDFGARPIVESLADRFGLRGLFGVDLIDAEGGPWVTEVNPRYTASVEVLERAHGITALTADVPTDVPEMVVGKGILFAPRSLTFPEHGPWDTDTTTFADLPHPGDRIEPGWPVLTFFEQAPNVTECARLLSRRAIGLTRSLFG